MYIDQGTPNVDLNDPATLQALMSYINGGSGAKPANTGSNLGNFTQNYAQPGATLSSAGAQTIDSSKLGSLVNASGAGGKSGMGASIMKL